MKEITLKSPKIIDFDTINGINCKISHEMFSEKKLGINLPVNYSLFINITEKSDDGKLVLTLDVNKIFEKEIIEKLVKIKTIIGTCSQIGEVLNKNLKSLNDRLKNKNELKEIFEEYDSKYYKLDFMGHRDLFSKIIKSKKIDEVNSVIQNYNVKNFSKTFCNFILDRNKYTHGELMYWYPENKTILEYKSENGKKVYGELNMEILNSYTKCYSEINGLLNTIELKKL